MSIINLRRRLDRIESARHVGAPTCTHCSSDPQNCLQIKADRLAEPVMLCADHVREKAHPGRQ